MHMATPFKRTKKQTKDGHVGGQDVPRGVELCLLLPALPHQCSY